MGRSTRADHARDGVRPRRDLRRLDGVPPVGYQTTLFGYGPGGYRFTDYIRVGAPLQLVFAVTTTLGIAFFFSL